MSVENGRICGRGVLALHSWEPLRRPGSVSNLKPKDHSKNPNSNQGGKIRVHHIKKPIKSFILKKCY